ncbi:hypothetical protein F2Q69_00056596 [Brassica cretica]|uniref:Uncharacterized protein n=1 Tax=Brassica cretica TaxID=69181 RepID=A0A8S9MNP2_BRACR|nr:hypothetical protein F2Q69_00056596 [Brassica cretica]
MSTEPWRGGISFKLNRTVGFSKGEPKKEDGDEIRTLAIWRSKKNNHASFLVLVSIVLYNSKHHPQLISGSSVAQRCLSSAAFPSISSHSPLVNSPETLPSRSSPLPRLKP